MARASICALRELRYLASLQHFALVPLLFPRLFCFPYQAFGIQQLHLLVVIEDLSVEL